MVNNIFKIISMKKYHIQPTNMFRNTDFNSIKQSMMNEEIETRFEQLKFPLQDVRDLPEDQKQRNINIFSSDLARIVLTKTFKRYEQGQFNQKKMKQYFCNNFLANQIKFCYSNRLNTVQLRKADEHLRKRAFPFLKQRYPQTQSRTTNRKFNSIITPVQNLDSNANDLVFQSGVKFIYKQSGDYSKQIMEFLNYILKLLREQKIQNGFKTESLAKIFHKEMDQLFKKVEDQEWMIMAQKKQFEGKVKQEQNLFSKLNRQQLLQKLMLLQQKQSSFNSEQSLNKLLKKHDEQVEDHDTKKRQLEQEKKRQKYKKSVREYTKYSIGQKISENVLQFEDKQIKEGNLTITDSGLMRILTKWCEELEKCFKEVNIYSKEERFRMADGSERYTKKSHRQELYNQICNQEEQRIKFLQAVKENIYENQHKMLSDDRFLTLFRQFSSEDEGAVGYFATIMKKSFQNYLISYLNKLIHCILTAQQKLKAKYSKKQHYKVAVNLLSFKISDLLRCKCASKQTQIIALYEYLKYYSAKNPQKLEIVRVKNRLEEGTKDILINFKFYQKILVQMQLSIDQDNSTFIKCSDKANHFVYQLQRATFGPIIEICNVYGHFDPRAEFFRKKFQQINDQIFKKPDLKPNNCPNHQQESQTWTQTSLPIWCSDCLRFNSSLNLRKKHKICSSCEYRICCLCLQRKQELKNNEIELKFKELTKQSKSESIVKGKITIIDPLKKQKSEITVYLAYFNLKLFLFQLTQESFSYMGEAMEQKQFKKILKNKIVTKMETVTKQQEQQIKNHIYKEILKIGIKNTKKKMKKCLLVDGIKVDEDMFANQILDTVEVVNISNNSLTSISKLSKVFPNAKILLFHKNKIRDISGVRQWIKATELNLEGNQLSTIPEQISNMYNLQYLVLTNNKFTVFPDNICKIKSLQKLNFKQNKIKNISNEIGNLKQLQNLRLNQNFIDSLPDAMSQLTSLIELDLSNNLITTLPNSMKKMISLRQIMLEQNKIRQIPVDMFEDMNQLVKIDLSSNEIQQFPPSLKNKNKLVKLDFQLNNIKELPDFLFELTSLEEIDVSLNKISKINFPQVITAPIKYLHLEQNQFKQIPHQIFTIKSILKLKFGNKGLQKIPEQISELTNLKQLSMQSMGLKQFPSFLYDLDKKMKLQTLSLDNNEISDISSDIENLKSSLNQLYLSNNQFKTIPKGIFTLTKLQNLGMSKNLLTQIDPQLSEIRSLQKLKVEQNKITSVPRQILSLPQMRELFITVSNLQQGFKEQAAKQFKRVKFRQDNVALKRTSKRNSLIL